MSRKPRHLKPEEEKLWKKVAETATPLKRGSIALPFEPAKSPPEVPIKPVYTPVKFRIGEKAITDTAIPAQKTPVHMDRKAYSKMKRGRTAPDARIDLHGMTADVAHTALIAFLQNAHAKKQRLVLVITGKGRQTENGRQGILRRQVPLWLEQAPLRQIVLQVTEAHQRHGGSGALYVYLRR